MPEYSSGSQQADKRRAICHESSQALNAGRTGSTDGVVSPDRQPTNTARVEFYNLILLNQKYTYLQIVDTFSYGFRKYSTI